MADDIDDELLVCLAVELDELLELVRLMVELDELLDDELLELAELCELRLDRELLELLDDELDELLD